jgi:hypothetical protein
LPDASERIRIDAKTAPRAASRAKPARWAAYVPRDRRVVAGAALAAMMIGIVVNAVALQHGRRVDLGLAPDPTAVAAIKPAPVPAAKPVPAPKLAAAEPVPEPPRPPQPTTVAHAAAKSPDAIADFLRAQSPDKKKLTLAAQGALAKLGFSVKPTGALDAQTRSALAEFQKSRHMPVSAEVTPKLVSALKAAAQAE